MKLNPEVRLNEKIIEFMEVNILASIASAILTLDPSIFLNIIYLKKVHQND